MSKSCELKRFGEVVTMDHIDARSTANESVDGEMFALVIYDVYSKFVGAYLVFTKTSHETWEKLSHYKGRDNIDYMYFRRRR